MAFVRDPKKFRSVLLIGGTVPSLRNIGSGPEEGAAGFED
jgi:hypothetical protein